MPKRTSIKGRGADAWFTANQQPAKTQESEDDTSTSNPLSQQDSIPANQQASTSANKPLVKATFYLTNDDITDLEELKLRLRKETGERIDKSELIRRAINLLVKQYTSTPANQ